MTIVERFRELIVDHFPSLRTQVDAMRWRSESVRLSMGNELTLEHYYEGKWVEVEQDSSANKTWQSRVGYGSKDTTYLIFSADQEELIPDKEKDAVKCVMLTEPDLRGVKMKISIGPKVELYEMDEAEVLSRIEYNKTVDLNLPIDPQPPIKKRMINETLFDIQNLGESVNKTSLLNLQGETWEPEILNSKDTVLSSKLGIDQQAKLTFGNWDIFLNGRVDGKLSMSYVRHEQ